MKNWIIFFLMIATFASCKNSRYVYRPDNIKTENLTQSVPQQQIPSPQLIGIGREKFLPNATAFRMSGDYAKNVAVTLGSNGNLLYFPAPSDITAYSEPIYLDNGWWLNCQGLGRNSVFTRYTFAEYASLPETPTIEQLKNSIIPGAKVTDFIELPMKMNDAVNNINEVKSYIKNK